MSGKSNQLVKDAIILLILLFVIIVVLPKLFTGSSLSEWLVKNLPFFQPVDTKPQPPQFNADEADQATFNLAMNSTELAIGPYENDMAAGLTGEQDLPQSLNDPGFDHKVETAWWQDALAWLATPMSIFQPATQTTDQQQ